MTLKEFTQEYLSLDTPEGQIVWRKAFPTELREREFVVKQGGLFRSTKTDWILEEMWVRYHRGDIIDIEWRALDTKRLPVRWMV